MSRNQRWKSCLLRLQTSSGEAQADIRTQQRCTYRCPHKSEVEDATGIRCRLAQAYKVATNKASDFESDAVTEELRYISLRGILQPFLGPQPTWQRAHQNQHRRACFAPCQCSNVP